ncbi:hypothetical protein [Bacillus sp. Marseille-P3661]|uniref:hypothetical protein n=1 Tax=Bacillus sp. Marseille-P3661 TaxID=1936234 RepID=UPI000C850522|nr:hypothetical protein [Bacillus sp. Marseille-P3661]
MIKRAIISFFMLFVLLCNIAEAGASDQVVLSHATSDAEYDHIFLMADKIEGNWMAHKNFTVQVGIPPEELLYHFPDWYNDKFTPDLIYEDINDDTFKDIIVVLIAGSGSGVSMKEVHVLNQMHNPNRNYEEVPVEPINAAVKRLIKMERHGDQVTILTKKKKYVVDIAKFNYLPDTYFTSPSVGSVEDYWTEKGTLYGSTTVFITPAGQIGRLRIEYDWDGTKYIAKTITFDETEPFTYPSNKR